MMRMAHSTFYNESYSPHYFLAVQNYRLVFQSFLSYFPDKQRAMWTFDRNRWPNRSESRTIPWTTTRARTKGSGAPFAPGPGTFCVSRICNSCVKSANSGFESFLALDSLLQFRDFLHTTAARNKRSICFGTCSTKRKAWAYFQRDRSHSPRNRAITRAQHFLEFTSPGR